MGPGNARSLELLTPVPRRPARRLRRLLAGTVVLGLAAALPAAAQDQAAPRTGFADLAAKVAPAVVNVSTSRAGAQAQPAQPMPQVPPGSPFEDFFKEFFDRDRQPEEQRRSFSLGSGFVIDASGFVVTNNHVIADADEIKVVFNNDREFKATLVGRDPKTDLALLKITDDKPFPTLRWADSDAVRVGDWMIAIGNPFGLGASTTAGIVSARGRDIRAGAYDDFIQIDAAINRGNSGGPSFNLDGDVFGVNTAIFSPSGGSVGIGFAIPSNLARPVIDSLMRTGKVARGWLGVRIQTVTKEIAESMGLPGSDGALVASVTPGGPAAAAGIAAGDVILDFDGKAVTRMRSLPRLVAETAVGSDSTVTLWRKNEKTQVQVRLGELPDDDQVAALGNQSKDPAPDAVAPIDDLGLTVGPLTDELKTQFSLKDGAKGVVVTDVDPNGPAAGEGIKAGDLVVEVGQEEIDSAPSLLAKVRQAKADGKKAALLLVDRQGDLRFVALRFKG